MNAFLSHLDHLLPMLVGGGGIVLAAEERALVGRKGWIATGGAEVFPRRSSGQP